MTPDHVFHIVVVLAFCGVFVSLCLLVVMQVRVLKIQADLIATQGELIKAVADLNGLFRLSRQVVVAMNDSSDNNQVRH